MQAKNSKLQQESEQLSSAKEHLALENLRSANQLKVHTLSRITTNTGFECKWGRWDHEGLLALLHILSPYCSHELNS